MTTAKAFKLVSPWMNRDIEIFFIIILSNWKNRTILTNTCKNSILLLFLGQPYLIRHLLYGTYKNCINYNYVDYFCFNIYIDKIRYASEDWDLEHESVSYWEKTIFFNSCSFYPEMQKVSNSVPKKLKRTKHFTHQKSSAISFCSQIGTLGGNDWKLTIVFT